MNTSKRLLAVFCAIAMLVTSHTVTAIASSEREDAEALLYVQNSRLVLEDYIALAVAKEDTNIYNDKGNVVAVFKKDAGADVLNLDREAARYEVVSGSVKGFVDMDKVLVGKTAELRAVIVLDEKAEAEDRTFRYESKEVTSDQGGKSFEVMVDGSLDKAEPVMIEVEQEVAVIKEENVAKAEKKKEKKEAVKTSTGKIKYTQADLDLLAAIVYCESGNHSHQGKLAVANVVLNRVKSKKFPNTIKGVIYAPRQFSPARNGRLSRALKNKAPKSCYKAAQDALNGNNNVEGYLYFDGSRHQGGYKKIDSHYFWKTPW